MKLVIKNINKLVQTEETTRKWVAGSDMKTINYLEDAFIEIENGLISNFGTMEQWNGIDDWNNTQIIDAEDGMVFPSYCDSHTHLVHASTREDEWIERIKGTSYKEIADNGGGILNSAKKLQETSFEDLLNQAKDRLKKVIESGTGAIEIKSGYGLTLESELKILRVIKELKNSSPVTIKATLLAAHALPLEFKGRKDEYLDLIIDKLLPIVEQEGLADYIDIFCEEGYFSVSDLNRLLIAGKKHGLQAKTHVNQFTSLGGVKASVENGALSVDHLEIMSDQDMESLQGSSCMATFLPSCSFFLGIPYGPARELINKGLPLALASDYNPGSSPNWNMNLVTSLACIKMNLTPEEAINASTINSAYAMGVSDKLGSIAIGKKANLFITKPMPSYGFMQYSFGENNIENIILNGKILNPNNE
ncbi:MAG: imidazolonepropionase [Flavobacteriales bacterium]|jgi:imidazolonepropionase|tara:strand:- start:14256 stop:15515 length:1260 start_codon:yes stop_codon:yes gene_type:complete